MVRYKFSKPTKNKKLSENVRYGRDLYTCKKNPFYDKPCGNCERCVRFYGRFSGDGRKMVEVTSFGRKVSKFKARWIINDFIRKKYLDSITGFEADLVEEFAEEFGVEVYKSNEGCSIVGGVRIVLIDDAPLRHFFRMKIDKHLVE